MLHPSAALIVWLAAVLSVQFLGYGGLGLILAGMLFQPALWRPWLAYVGRARWLLLMLWLILAYNTPGEAMGDFSWAPTYEGLTEATRQALRLVVLLACLAWLFARLGHDGLVSALWGILQPVRSMGLDTGRLVVRLSLVLENLQSQPATGDWKKILAADAALTSGPDVLYLSLPPWAARDTWVVLAAVTFLVGSVVL